MNNLLAPVNTAFAYLNKAKIIIQAPFMGLRPEGALRPVLQGGLPKRQPEFQPVSTAIFRAVFILLFFIHTRPWSRCMSLSVIISQIKCGGKAIATDNGMSYFIGILRKSRKEVC